MPEFAAGLIILALIVAVLAWRADKSRRATAANRYAGSWEVVERTERGATVVGVQRVVDGREVDFVQVKRIPDDAADWVAMMDSAHAEADERKSRLERQAL